MTGNNYQWDVYPKFFLPVPSVDWPLGYLSHLTKYSTFPFLFRCFRIFFYRKQSFIVDIKEDKIGNANSVGFRFYLAIWRPRPELVRDHFDFFYLFFKGPCSPKRLCALFFLFWNAIFVKSSVFWLGRRFRFFHGWPKRDSTHTEDGNFQLREIIFLEYRASKAAWVNMGF